MIDDDIICYPIPMVPPLFEKEDDDDWVYELDDEAFTELDDDADICQLDDAVTELEVTPF